MKTKTTYICELCQKEYNTEDKAIECEAQGIFDASKYPAGLMFEYHHHGYVGIFSIPKKIEFWEKRNQHLGYTSYWACRKNYGDSVGDEQCGGTFFRSDDNSLKQWIKHHFVSSSHINSDEFNRMVDFLKSQKITPSYYNESGELIIVN